MEEIDIIQNIVIVILIAVSVWLGLGVKQSESKISPLDELEFHNQKLYDLLNTEKGKKILVDYVVYELALQGEIADLVETINTPQSNVEQLQKQYPSSQADVQNAAKKGSEAREIAGKIFGKINGALTSSVSGVFSWAKGILSKAE